jgi:hypothetical protein
MTDKGKESNGLQTLRIEKIPHRDKEEEGITGFPGHLIPPAGQLSPCKKG